MNRITICPYLKILLVFISFYLSSHHAHSQKVVCPNFQAGHDSLNKLIAKYLPTDSAKFVYFQFGWAANNLRLYSNVIVDFEDIMPYAFYKAVEKGFVYASTEKLQYFYMQYEYGNGKSICWIRNSPLENPPPRKPKVEKKEEIIYSDGPSSNELPRMNPDLSERLKELQSKGNSSGSAGRGERSSGKGSGTPSRQQLEIIEDIEIDDEVDLIAPEPSIRMEKEETVKSEEILEFYTVQDKAQYKGGEAALYTFIANNIQYPPLALENNIQGTIQIQFVVSKEGNVRDVKATGSRKGYGLEEEAIRIVKLTNGNWTPAKQRDKPVDMIYRLPVKFVLP